MSSLLWFLALVLLGFGLGAAAGRDLAFMAVRISSSGSRLPVPWGLGKRLALFLLGLAVASPQGPAGVLAASAGYLAGFAVFTARGWLSLGR